MSESLEHVGPMPLPHPGDAHRAALMLAGMAAIAPGAPMGPRWSDNEVRAELKSAIEANAPAELAAFESKRAVERAKDYLASCADDLAELVEMDRRAAEARTASLRAWASNGSDSPPVLEPPMDPAVRQAAVKAIEDRRQATVQALAELQAEAAKDERRAAVGRVAVRDALAKVFIVEGEAIAVELHRGEHELRMKRTRMLNLAAFEPALLGVPPEPLKLSREARALADKGPANMYARAADPKQVAELQAKLEALLHDPDASIEV